MTYRRGTSRDALSAARVNVQSWRESFAGIRPKAVLDSISVQERHRIFRLRFKDPAYRMFVAQRRGEGVIGFVDCGPPRADKRHGAEIYAFYVLRACQRQGIGSKLFSMIVDAMLAEGYESLCVIVLEDSPFRRFYEKRGGREIARGGADGDQDAHVVYGWSDLRHLRDLLVDGHSDASARQDSLTG